MDAVTTVQISNAYFENITAYGSNVITSNINYAIQIQNVTMNNITGDENSLFAFIYVLNYFGGTAIINQFSVFNSYLGANDGFAVDNDSSNSPVYITVQNSQFRNITVSSDSAIIEWGMAKQLVVQNITYKDIIQKDQTDTTNIMLYIRGLDMNTTGRFSINTISVQNSSLSLINLMNIINSNISTVNAVLISDISYINSNLQSFDNLVVLSSIEINAALNISISNILMSNITFSNKGVLMLFEQQTSIAVVVTNCLFENTVNAGIHFEPYNKNNPKLLTNIKFINMTVRNSSANFKSFMEASSGAVISIYDSVFVNNCNFLSGSVVSADSLGTSVSFYNNTFQNNTSVQGGVFYVENQALVIISNSKIQNNFAIQSGVIQASNEGGYQIYSSIIFENYAYSIPISEVLLASSESIIINNWTIYQNSKLAKDVILNEIQEWSVLWFMKSSFKSYISTNSDLMGSISKEFSIQLISSSFIIENSTTIYSQNLFINSFQSKLHINNTVLRDSISHSSIISFSYSTFVSDNLTLFNIFSNKLGNSLLEVLFGSVVNISNLKYTNSNSTLLYAYQTQIGMTNVGLSNMQLDDNLVYMAQWTGIMMQNVSVTNITSARSYAFYFYDSSVDLIKNMSLSNISKIGMFVSSTNITEVSSLTMKNVAQGITSQRKSFISNLHDSLFAQVGSANVSNGGAIDIIDSSASISRCQFSQNQAQSGAAISVRCTNYNLWNNSFMSLNFVRNTAEVQGGAIYYNFKRPTMSNLMFDGNTAPYGVNIASYSIKIVEVGSLNTSVIYQDIPSGIKIGSSLKLVLLDFDNQTVSDNSNSIKINAITQGASVSGFNSAKINNGIAEFNNLIFIAAPGAKHIMYKATSNAIDVIKNQAQGVSTYTTIDVSFRFWMPGEAQISSSLCQTWAPGSYSLLWNSTSCKNWPNSVIWPGGAELEVSPEYWRISPNSTTILSCPLPSACLGGYSSQDEYPVKWETGYKGYLCSEWDIVDGVKYAKTSEIQWAKWDIGLINILKFVGVVFAAFIFLTIMIIILIRKKKENQTSILLRMLTNYFQLISISMTFKVKFPISMSQISGSADTFGSTSDTYLSYDWFISGIQYTGFAPSVDIFKIVLTALVPIALFLVYLLIWTSLYFVLRKWCSNLKRNLAISGICIVYILHPSITKNCLRIFECTQVDANDMRMTLYMNYKCYSFDHVFWMITAAVPMLVIWIIGAPFLALVILYKHRKDLDNGYIKNYMLVLYQGLKPNAFYWEFVNTLRKSLVLTVSVFMSTQSSNYQVLISVIILYWIYKLQLKLSPYKYNENNYLEQHAINSGTLTIFWGLIFAQNNNYTLFTMLALVLLIIVNSVFIILWVFYFLLSLNLKYESMKKFLKIYAFIIMKSQFLKTYYNLHIDAVEKPENIKEVFSKSIKHKKAAKKLKNAVKSGK